MMSSLEREGLLGRVGVVFGAAGVARGEASADKSRRLQGIAYLAGAREGSPLQCVIEILF